ncbi:MAG: 4-aminobutyrate--2-oxoglutarate transaminase [SAR324 cluster bacterium]|uniref:4-aminobutyrate--2-oxoglutarate transaminase n=1 Tax=SAR324 cluster bacterium TaxID=2024889 RepID=A0A2A4T564_9DELT|nr:MAG: 4-aminobutyrate--2-oxoglutarate transaminase [SAR324 cluster bacterium]
MSRSSELRERREKAIPRAVAQTTPCVIQSAKGATIIDVDGNEWIDFTGGIGVMNVGHRHEAIMSAIQEQMGQFLHSCFHVSIYESYIQLAEKLNQITPGDFEKKTMLVTTGAEAVENAIKIARSYTKRPAVLCFENAFHGRTLMGMSLTSKVTPYKTGFGPYAPEIYRVPFPYAYQMTDGDQKEANQITLKAIRKAFVNQVNPEDIAAIIFEPVQGEGGFVQADAEFFQELRELTQQYGILTICDEIQTGFGRTGSLFASGLLDIDYDMLVSAKSLAAGLPLSAVTGRTEIMDHPQVGGLGGTYAGSPIACVAALASIDLFENTDLLEQGRKGGEFLRQEFARLAEKYPLIGDIRGLGPMVAVELVEDLDSKAPAVEKTKALQAYCTDKRLSIITAGTSGNVLRILAPLNTELELLKKGIAIIEEGLEAIHAL